MNQYELLKKVLWETGFTSAHREPDGTIVCGEQRQPIGAMLPDEPYEVYHTWLETEVIPRIDNGDLRFEDGLWKWSDCIGHRVSESVWEIGG